MTIIRRWQSGWESGSTDEISSISSANVVVVTSPKTGTYSIRIDTHLSPLPSFFQQIPSTAQARTGFACYYATDDSVNWIELVRFRNGTSDIFEIQIQHSTRQIRLMVNSVQQDITATSAYEVNTWNHFGFDIKANTSNGWAYVYKDGALILSFEGNTGSTNVDNVNWGNSVDAGLGSAYYAYFDDHYIDDTTGETSSEPVPILRFYKVSPNGNGNYADWDGSDGNKVDNYQLLDEAPPSDSDYVQAVSSGLYDSYAMSTFTLAANQEIKSVIPVTRVKRTGTTEDIGIGTRLSSTDVLTSGFTLNTSYSYISARQVEKPGGGDWTQTDLDSFEIVLKSEGTY